MLMVVLVLVLLLLLLLLVARGCCLLAGASSFLGCGVGHCVLWLTIRVPRSHLLLLQCLRARSHAPSFFVAYPSLHVCFT